MTAHPEAPVTLDHASRGVQLALAVVLGIVAVAAFVLGALPLASIARDWAALPAGVAVLLPVALDAAAVAAALAAIVRRTRGQRASLETALLGLTVLVSTSAQVVHAWVLGQGVWDPRTIITAAVLGSAPVIVLLSSHAAIRTLTPPKGARKRPAKPTKPAAAPTPAPAPAPAKPAAPAATMKPASAPRPQRPTPVPPAEVPPRNDGEDDLDYGVRLVQEHALSYRSAAAAAGVGRDRISRAIAKQGAQAA